MFSNIIDNYFIKYKLPFLLKDIIITFNFIWYSVYKMKIKFFKAYFNLFLF